MKHYRILEKRGDKKQYIVQYLKKFIFGLYFWRKLNDTIYNKYEEAFNEVKKVIEQSDYETPEFGYHYIDAYKIFKYTSKDVAEISQPKIATTSKTNKSTVAQNIDPNRKINKSVFVPKQK
jgi:hypothetical protein